MNEQPETGSRAMPGAEVVHVLDFVHYQEGSIVSREIIKRNAGNVTLFAFDAGQGLSEPHFAIRRLGVLVGRGS